VRQGARELREVEVGAAFGVGIRDFAGVSFEGHGFGVLQTERECARWSGGCQQRQAGSGGTIGSWTSCCCSDGV
jgi:hypothetical protein